MIFLRCPGLSKDKYCCFWALWTHPKIPKSCKLCFWAFIIMKSGFYYTIWSGKKPIKLLKVLFKYIFIINGPKNGHNYFGIFSYDFRMIFLWFSYDVSYFTNIKSGEAHQHVLIFPTRYKFGARDRSLGNQRQKA